MIDLQWVKGLGGNEALLKKLYKTFRNPFISFIKKYGLEESDAIEVFHDTLIVLRQQAQSGKLHSVKSSFKTYLFAVGKYKAIDLVKRKGKSILYFSDNLPEIPPLAEDEEIQEAQKSNLILKGLSQLGKSCQQMLTLFYLKGLKISEIQKMEGYENENTVRAQKSRCLKKLKTWVENQKDHD